MVRAERSMELSVLMRKNPFVAEWARFPVGKASRQESVLAGTSKEPVSAGCSFTFKHSKGPALEALEAIMGGEAEAEEEAKDHGQGERDGGATA